MSGMEKIKKYKWYLFPLIALIIINIAVAALKYNSYKDETIVLAQVITENKSEEITFKEAENILENTDTHIMVRLLHIRIILN